MERTPANLVFWAAFRTSVISLTIPTDISFRLSHIPNVGVLQATHSLSEY